MLHCLLKRMRFFNAAAIVCLSVLTNHTANAQQYSIVTGLGVNGKTAASAEIPVFYQGKSPQTVLKVNDTLRSGTQIIVPTNVIIKLQSPGGTQVVTSTSGQPVRYVINYTAQGENHVVNGLGAQIDNTVKKMLGYNYRNRNEKGTTAASRGTIFTFTDSSAGIDSNTVVSTSEGIISFSQKAVCTIDKQRIDNKRYGRATTKSFTRGQSNEDPPFHYTDTVFDYQGLNRAIYYIDEAIYNLYERTGVQILDYENYAADLMCLGDLHMANKAPDKAAGAYMRAAKLYDQLYGALDLLTIEAELSLGQAYRDGKKQAGGMRLAKLGISKLRLILSFELKNKSFLVSRKVDSPASKLLCDKITEIWNLLSWAYDITGNITQRNLYHDKATTTCN